jgi:hypothetical protein
MHMNPHKFTARFLAIMVVVVFFLFCFWLYIYTSSPKPLSQTPQTQEVKWATYTSTKYGFQIDYPETWTVFEDTKVPGINIYKKSDTKPDYLSHHSNFTHVSIYPQGIGTEGVLGQTASSSVTFSALPRQSYDFLLKDGKKWASMASFINSPSSWQPWGYIWAGIKIDNLKLECIRDGKVIMNDVCEIGPESINDQTVRSGSIDTDDRKTEEQILASFKFIKK